MHHTALRDDARRRIDRIGRADILVGIPSFNNVGTIGYVAEMGARGMTEHFPDLKPVLVNSDGGSTDGTREKVPAAAASTGVEVISTRYDGPPGKGSAFRFSGALARSFLEKDVWLTDVARFGIDVFMTTTAINEGYPVCQANLGAKVHDPKDPAASLGPMFMQ